jgi:hypothetical protein
MSTEGFEPSRRLTPSYRYSQTIKTNPDHIPFRYLSENELSAKPPIDIPQARHAVFASQCLCGV